MSKEKSRDGFWRPPAMWQGETVFIIGGGPSLKGMSLYPDFEPLHSRRVIGVNDAYTLGSWVDVCFFHDHPWYLRHNKDVVLTKDGSHPGLKQFGGLVVCCCDSCKGEPDVFVAMKRSRGFLSGQGYIAWNMSSGAAAINLAGYFGAKRIVLIGFDCKPSEDNKGNWHDNNMRPAEKMHFDLFLKGFAALKEAMLKKGVTIEILNATPDSALDIWPKVDLEELLINDVKKPAEPTVVVEEEPEEKVVVIASEPVVDIIEEPTEEPVVEEIHRDVRFTELITGKRVALIGPSPYLMDKGRGQDFDDYDVVCRVNECWPFGDENDYGQRTDVVFHSGAGNTMANVHKSLRHNRFLTSELSFIVAAQRETNNNENLFGNIAAVNSNLEAFGRTGSQCQIKLYCAGNSFWLSVYYEIGRPRRLQATARGDVHGPNTGIMALRILLEHDPEEVLVSGFSFFKEGHDHKISHHPSYMEWGGNDFKVKRNQVHNQEAQVLYFKNMLMPLFGKKLRIDSHLASELNIDHDKVFDLSSPPVKPYKLPVSLRRCFAEKRVVMVGPSPHLQGQGQGAEIDDYDVVCRTNELGVFGLEEDYGSRTDILFHCGAMPATERLLEVAEKQPAALKGLKAIVIPQRSSTDVTDALKQLKKPVHLIPDNMWFDMNRRVGIHGNTGLLGLMWLLEQCAPKSVFVTGWSFYRQGLTPEKRHHEAYKEWGGDAGSANECIPENGQSGQDRQLPQFRFFSRALLSAHKNLSCDSYMKDLIKADRLRYAVYRVFYGAKFIEASIESILPFVDKVFVFVYHKAFGGITKVKKNGEMVDIPENIDDIEKKVRMIPSTKVKVILDDWPLPDNQFTYLVNAKILPWNIKPDTILFMEADMVWDENQLRKGLEEFEGSDRMVASSRTIELWREPRYAIPERNRPACMFWNMEGIEEVPTTGKSAQLRSTPRLNAIVHNFGFCLDDATMEWKHLLGIAFADAIQDSAPNPDWLERWRTWDFETNNKNLGISLGHEEDIPCAYPYSSLDLPNQEKGTETMREIGVYDHRSAVEQWQKPPVDNVGYMKVTTLLNFPDQILLDIMTHAAKERYSLNGWRNDQNKWRELLGLDTTEDKTILDFGCGIGIESVEFARAGNRIILADIVPNNIKLSKRVLKLYDYDVEQEIIVEATPPYAQPKTPPDIFYANGVLHHTPLFREILQWAVGILAPDGEVRLMLYSDKGWEWATKTMAPGIDTDVRAHPKFKRFVAAFDGVGFYANWFSREKIEHLVGDFLDIVSCDYITKDGRYLVATLKPKGAQ